MVSPAGSQSEQAEFNPIALFVQMVMAREDLQFRLSSCRTIDEVIALASVVGIDLAPEVIKALITAPQDDPGNCPYWPWTRQSRRFIHSFLDENCDPNDGV